MMGPDVEDLSAFDTLEGDTPLYKMPDRITQKKTIELLHEGRYNGVNVTGFILDQPASHNRVYIEHGMVRYVDTDAHRKDIMGYPDDIDLTKYFK